MLRHRRHVIGSDVPHRPKDAPTVSELANSHVAASVLADPTLRARRAPWMPQTVDFRRAEHCHHNSSASTFRAWKDDRSSSSPSSVSKTSCSEGKHGLPTGYG